MKPGYVEKGRKVHCAQVVVEFQLKRFEEDEFHSRRSRSGKDSLILWFIEDWNENYRVRRWELNSR